MTRTGSEAVAVHRPAAPITRWNPFDEFTELRHRMDDLFNQTFGYTPLSRLIPQDNLIFEPIVDIYEEPNKVVFMTALPGYKPEDVHVDVTGETIMVKGERKPIYEEEKAVPHRVNNVSGASSFSINYTLPCEIDPVKVKALFSDGVLKVEMPIVEAAKPKSVKVKVLPNE